MIVRWDIGERTGKRQTRRQKEESPGQQKETGAHTLKRTLQLYTKEMVTTAMLDYYKKITGIA